MSSAWNSVLDFLSKLVVPDWASLIGLLPLALALAALGFVGLMFLLWAWQTIRRPRARLRYVEGPQPAALDAEGGAIFPPGEPFCRYDSLVYPPGSTRCERCHNDLGVTCPMCGVGRDARVDTCGNCGLVLRIASRERFTRPAGPPPGGAAVA